MKHFGKIEILVLVALFVPEYPSLELKRLEPFSIVSYPEDNEFESVDGSNGGLPYIVNPDAVEIRNPDTPQNNGKGRIAIPESLGFMPGLRQKIVPENVSGSRGIQLKVRGRVGVGVPTAQSDSSSEISWDKAFSQSVKRVVVHDSNPGHSGKLFGRYRPIVSNPVSFAATTTPPPTVPSPPPHEQVARMARFIVHNSDWSSLATISSRSPTKGFPFANVFSVSDGSPGGNSTGTPYMYVTPLDVSVLDLKQNARSSMTMSLAQGSYCKSHQFDPEDPRCAHVILTGHFKKILNNTAEAEIARNALFNRHPDMASWPADHGWFFAKLEISHVLVLDYFGGAKSVSPSDYFAANP